MDYLGLAVTVLLVAPPVVLTAAGALLVLAAVIPGARRLRETFLCPFARRAVTADFLVAEGAVHPHDLAACTAFAVPTRVTCAKRCCAMTDVRWGLSRVAFPRWSLTAGGPVGWRDGEEAAPTR
jgi:hypothetical protein